MVKKFVYGTPFETEAVVKEIPSSEGNPVKRPHQLRPLVAAIPGLRYLLHRERLFLHHKAC